MTTATLSSKGQLVIPREIRRRAGLKAGDILDIDIEDESGEVRLRKARAIDELSDRFTSLIKPETPPLRDVGSLYGNREARM